MSTRCEQVGSGSRRKEGCASALERVLFSPGRLSLTRSASGPCRPAPTERLSFLSRTMSTRRARPNAMQFRRARSGAYSPQSMLDSRMTRSPCCQASTDSTRPRLLMSPRTSFFVFFACPKMLANCLRFRLVSFVAFKAFAAFSSPVSALAAVRAH
jgi:hypothetical protein